MLHMKAGAEAHFFALLDQLETVTPDCYEDDRYIAERGDLDTTDRAELAAICDACPLIQGCTAYAQAAQPTAGWWPGHNLKTKEQEAA